MKGSRCLAGWLVVLGLCLLPTPALALQPDQVLIVANDLAPGSVEIAEHYARLRNIPAGRIVKLHASQQEQIERSHFTAAILEPISKALVANPKLLVIVCTRGVPLKIKEHVKGDEAALKAGFVGGRDFASVDGELALARYGKYELPGVVNNPYFDKQEPLAPKHKVLVVTRLDGPTVEIAKGLVEKAIVAEALGMAGESFLDTRGPNLKGGYKQRDDLMVKIGPTWKQAGLPFAHDQKPRVFDLSARDTLHYYGWYAGTPTFKGPVRFRTGSIAVHLHSFSGATVRNPKANWVAPLLSYGCTATYGTTYEPLTIGFPFEHLFWDRLMRGFSFGEAGQIANRLLSWQAVFVGDPLYTPYPKGWKAQVPARRKRVLEALQAGSPAELTDPTLKTCYALLRRRADAIQADLSRDPRAAVDAFQALRFLVQELGLDAWLTGLTTALTAQLEARLEEITKQLKKTPAATAEYDAALATWTGLPIHAQVKAFEPELTKLQDKFAKKALKKAQAAARRNKLVPAFLLAHRVAGLRFSTRAKAGKALETELLSKARKTEFARQTKRYLLGVIKQAKRLRARKRLARAAALLAGVEAFPKSAERAQALALQKELAGAAAK